MASVGSASFGFDFGTSNSSIGSYADGGPRLIGVQQGRTSIPTAMFFSFEDGEIAFGFEALARYLDRDLGRLMRSLKGVLGSSLIHEATQVAGRKLRFIDVISLFISYMREAAGNPTKVVVGRPVRFVDDDDAADEEAERQLQWAAEQAGFTFVEFQFEPIAAALDYERSVTEEQLAFVADIGGGTSDFSIVRVSPFRRGKADRLSDILGCSGVHIGGTDFDKWLSMRTVMPHLGLGSQLRHKNMQPPVWWYLDLATWHRINVMYDPRVATDIRRVRRDALEPDKLDLLAATIEARRGHEILAAVERAKVDLSKSDATVLGLSDMVDCGDLTILRQQLDESISDGVAKIMDEVQSTLRHAAIAPEAINAVFMTGGSSKMPLLRSCITSIFPGVPIVESDEFGSVAKGLSIDAHNRFGNGSAGRVCKAT